MSSKGDSAGGGDEVDNRPNDRGSNARDDWNHAARRNTPMKDEGREHAPMGTVVQPRREHALGNDPDRKQKTSGCMSGNAK